MKGTMLELTALWMQEGKDGVKYLSGKLGNNKVLIFKNSRKKNPKEPDYRVYLVPSEDRYQKKETVVEKEEPTDF